MSSHSDEDQQLEMTNLDMSPSAMPPEQQQRDRDVGLEPDGPPSREKGRLGYQPLELTDEEKEAYYHETMLNLGPEDLPEHLSKAWLLKKQEEARQYFGWDCDPEDPSDGGTNEMSPRPSPPQAPYWILSGWLPARNEEPTQAERVATARAQLQEVLEACDGYSPGAAKLKAQADIPDDWKEPPAPSELHTQFRISHGQPEKQWPFPELPPWHELNMAEDLKAKLEADQKERVSWEARAVEAGLTPADWEPRRDDDPLPKKTMVMFPVDKDPSEFGRRAESLLRAPDKTQVAQEQQAALAQDIRQAVRRPQELPAPDTTAQRQQDVLKSLAKEWGVEAKRRKGADQRMAEQTPARTPPKRDERER